MTDKVERIALRGIALVIFCGLLLACKAGKPPAPAEQRASASTSGSADAYRGVRWGATEKEAAKIIPFTECKEIEPDPYLKQPRRLCTSQFKIGEAQVEDEFQFLGGRFLYDDGQLAEADFDTVQAAFLAKYGKPKEESVSGLLWVIGGNTVLLQHESGNPFGHFTLFSREFDQRRREAETEKAKEAAKAL